LSESSFPLLAFLLKSAPSNFSTIQVRFEIG
jgi:hypothetical protein